MTNPASVSSHLKELRSRVLKSLLAWMLAAVGCLFFSPTIWGLLLAPIQDSPTVQLINLSPGEGVLADLTVCALVGLLIASPLILFQIHRFISPALLAHEKRIAVPWFMSAWALLVVGMWVAWQCLLPLLFAFFSHYNSGLASQQWTQMAYASFLFRTCLTLGLYFELPAIVWLLARWAVLSPSSLLRYAKPAILGIFVIAALCTPPDAFSMLLMAIPMLAVYGVSIGVAHWAYPPLGAT